MQSLLLNKLSIGYKNNILINELNTKFELGNINLILGRSGSGKSTLLKTIAGFQPSISGTIKQDAEESIFNPMGKIALAFQNPEVLFFNATVGEEVSYALKQLNLSPEEINIQSKEWLNKWGLNADQFWNRHPMSLSGGEQRRVALAACTVFSPSLIMLDEPLAGLDANGQLQLVNVIHELSANSVVIVVTHDPEIFLSKTKNILVINNDQGISFNNVNLFLQAAINDDDLYILPYWYKEAILGKRNSECLPLVDAQSVYDFINSGNNG